MVGNYKIDFLIPYVGVGINCLEFYIENILGTTANPENINIIVSHHSQEDLKILENSKIYKKIYKVIYAKKDEPNHHWHGSVSHTNALNELYKNISSDIVIFSDYDMAFVEKNWDEYIVAELIDNNIDFESIHNACIKVDKKLIKEVSLFDVYEGDKLPENKKSYGISFVISSNEKTLSDKEIDNIMNKLVKSLNLNFGAELRN